MSATRRKETVLTARERALQKLIEDTCRATKISKSRFHNFSDPAPDIRTAQDAVIRKLQERLHFTHDQLADAIEFPIDRVRRVFSSMIAETARPPRQPEPPVQVVPPVHVEQPVEPDPPAQAGPNAQAEPPAQTEPPARVQSPVRVLRRRTRAPIVPIKAPEAPKPMDAQIQSVSEACKACFGVVEREVASENNVREVVLARFVALLVLDYWGVSMERVVPYMKRPEGQLRILLQEAKMHVVMEGNLVCTGTQQICSKLNIEFAELVAKIR